MSPQICYLSRKFNPVPFNHIFENQSIKQNLKIILGINVIDRHFRKSAVDKVVFHEIQQLAALLRQGTILLTYLKLFCAEKFIEIKRQYFYGDVSAGQMRGKFF